jgi:hypothetical protein
MIGLATFLKFWPVGAGVLVLGAGSLAWRQHNIDEQEKGALRVELRAKDSTLAANATQLAHVDTLWRYDTTTVRSITTKLSTMHDTVLAHLTDTVLVQQFVTRADSAAKACVELLNDCTAFHTLATQRFATYEGKIALLEKAHPSSHHLTSDVVKIALGVVAGYLAHR